MKIVLLAAGFGSRLWPLSTSDKPKQFQNILGDQSLLQYTHGIFSKIAPPQDIHVLTLQGLEHWVYEQIPGISDKNILLVPQRRNTLPHTLFALRALAGNSTDPVLFSGTDVYISDQDEFVKSVTAGMRQFSGQTGTDTAILCSSAPRIDTNAGYIQAAEDGHVTNYLEKPGKEAITQLGSDSPLYKNMFTYITSLSSLEQMLPKMDEDISKLAGALIGAQESDITRAFLDFPMCDISNAAFAHADNLTAFVCKSDFLDMGSFAALYDINKKDDKQNVVIGDVYLEGDCHDNLIFNTTDSPLVLIDTAHSVVVQTPDGSLFSPFAQSSRVGEVYKQRIHKHHA